MGAMIQPWNTATIVPVPPLPHILSEWAAAIPLVCHLAGCVRGCELVVQLALSGHLWVDIFPKLGVLYGLFKLLKRVLSTRRARNLRQAGQYGMSAGVVSFLVLMAGRVP